MASKNNQNKSNLQLIDDKQDKQKDKKPNRNKFVVSGSVVILFLVAITFIGAPALGGLTSSSSRLIFGYYDGKPIEYQPDNYFARQRDNIAEQYRDSMTEDNSGFNLDFQLYQIWRQAFEQTTTHIALVSMAEDAGVFLTEEQIDEEIINSGPYTGSDGEFDESIYLNTSNTLRKSNRDYITEGLMQNEVVSQVFANRISGAEMEFIKSMNTPEKRFRYVVLPYSSYPAENISEYARENSSLFQKVSISRIALYDSEDVALAVHSAVSGDPALFEEEARNKSQDSFASKGGSMGSYVYHELKSFFDNTDDLDRIMNLKAGEVSDLVVNEDGWYIYKCDEAAVSLDFNNSEDLDSVRIYIQRYERGRMEDYFTSMGSDFVARVNAEEASFSGIASDMSLTYHDTDFFPLTYGNIGFSLYGNDFPLFKKLSVPDGDTTLQYTASDVHFLSTLTNLTLVSPLSEPVILDEAVVVVQLLEEQEASEEALGSADFYYTYAVNSWKEAQLTEALLVSDKLEDNFYEEFGKLLSEN